MRFTKVFVALMALVVAGAVSAATPERLREELVRALPLAEEGEVAEAMEILHEIGGCNTAPDRQDFEPVPYVGSEAEGIRKAIELIDGGRYALADGLARAMTGCRSMVLTAVMKQHEQRETENGDRSEREPRVVLVDEDECQGDFEFCSEAAEEDAANALAGCYPNCDPNYESFVSAELQNRLDFCAIEYYYCWLACCSQ